MTPPKAKRKETTNSPKLGQNEQPPVSDDTGRDRLRDIIVVFITYPLTPGQRAAETGKKHPWLEILSLVLKAALAAFALYLGK